MRIGFAVKCAASWVGLAAGSVGALLHAVPTESRLVASLTAFAPFLMLGVVAAVAGFALLRRWAAFAGALVIAAACVSTQAPAYLGDNADATGPRLTVLAANIYYGDADIDALQREVTDGVDVLVVVELTAEATERIAASDIGRTLPHSFTRPRSGGGGTGVWSRHPLRDPTVLPGFVLNTMRMTVDGPRSFTLYALHLVPPIPRNAHDWARELALLGDRLAGEPDGPVIAAGDYNATWDHRQFRALSTGGYRNASAASGDGPLLTYRAGRWYPPLIGIDHVLIRDIRALQTRSVGIPRSDHRAVRADLQLP